MNYAAQAYKYLIDSLPTLEKHSFPKDEIAWVRQTADLVQQAVHFTLPEGGIFDKHTVNSFLGCQLRLPYEIITMEYNAAPYPDGKSKKMVIVAIQDLVKGSDRVYIVGMYKHPDAPSWSLPLTGVSMPQDWYDPEYETLTDVVYKSSVTKMMPNTIDILLKTPDASIEKYQQALDRLHNDIAYATLSLCAVLACSNTSTEVVQKAAPPLIAARRAKQGKVPIWETRVLTVDTKKPKSKSNSNGGTHASPRTHLRRGHIRRVGDKRVWVSACVVGKSGRGIIDKSYEVR